MHLTVSARLMLALFFLMITSWGWAAEVERCAVCGMDLSKYPHTVFTIIWADGAQQRVCGVQCGLTLALKSPGKIESATARDLLSNRPFNVEEGYYVYHSNVITDMAPGFIAFSKREDAEGFQQGFGGKVVSFEEAMEIWSRKIGVKR